MLESVKIARRQSEIRQSLAELAAKPQPTEDETRAMTDMDAEYRANETRYRAALIAEDTERRDAGADLETRPGREWSALAARFELRQAALHLDEGRAFDGATAEVVSELRGAGGYRGVPVPWEALIERRTGETVAGGTVDPVATRPVIDRLFADSVADRMGVAFINVGAGETDIPVTTSSIAASWAASETGDVVGPTPYATTDRPLKPHYNLGVQVTVTRRAMKQTGAALEAAIRRDIAGTMRTEMDKAVFQGTGADGQPEGVLNISALTATAVNAVPGFNTFVDEVVAFMVGNAISDPGAVRLLMRPETMGAMHKTINADLQTDEYMRVMMLLNGRAPSGTFPPNVHVSSNALPEPTGDPAACPAIMTTGTNGVAPIFVGTWGAVDLVRDPYSDAKSGGLRLTALATMDVTFSRPAQTRILTGLRLAAAG